MLAVLAGGIAGGVVENFKGRWLGCVCVCVGVGVCVCVRGGEWGNLEMNTS